ncbi:hypothetical protein ACOSQ4_006349 [Xanthoceras sorbifolium]
MAIKLDMSKAYNKVEWPFIRGMMLKLGFSDSWIWKIMMCVSSVSYSYLINGEARDFLKPSRGLRQGDYLSPYLFLLCAEGLSSLFRSTEARGEIHGIQCGQGGPRISHLFFIDNNLVFLQASETECSAVTRILSAYEKASGQVINKDKSTVCFNKRLSCARQQQLRSCLGIKLMSTYDCYLELPSYVGASKHNLFNSIKDKVWRKLKMWLCKIFFAGGKEVLIKAVIQSITAYSMSLFKLPASLIFNLHRLMARF